jgi:alkylation response protein AidB-like acyl-CoA dehydrogenase
MDMDFDYSPEEEAFRMEVRAWLEENVKKIPNHVGEGEGDAPAGKYTPGGLWWHRNMHEAGYVGISWPKEYGCRGATLMEQLVFSEEMERAGAPGPSNSMGMTWVGPILMRYGTQEQKEHFIPRILNADDIWCTCYSEPASGSDMAAAQTTAILEGDEFVVNGQKVWTSGGHTADWGVLLARTDPDAPRKHRGLSYLYLDMKTPGITIRPLKQINGDSHFNEIFFDDVRIPKDQVIGEVNKGWYVAAGALEYERLVGASNERIKTVMRMVEMVKQGHSNRDQIKDPVVRQKLAHFYVEANVLKYMGLRAMTHRMREGKPGPQTSLGHLLEIESNQRLQDFALNLQGPYAQLAGQKDGIDRGIWQAGWLMARGMSIGGGTSEIQRNIIGERVLGLPRSY